MNTRSNQSKRLDLPKALQLLDYDLKLLEMVTSTYMTNASKYYAQLTYAIQMNNHAQGRFILHRMMPTLRLIGSEGIIQACEELHVALERENSVTSTVDASIFLDSLRKLNDELITSCISHNGLQIH